MITNQIGAEVYSVCEGEKIGYVVDFIVSQNAKKIIKVCVVDNEDEGEYLVDVSQIARFSNDVLLIKSRQALMPFDLENNNQIITRKKVVNFESANIAFVIGYDCDKNYKITKIFLDTKEELNPEDIFVCGENIICNVDKSKKFALKNTKSKNIIKQQNILVKIMDKQETEKEEDISQKLPRLVSSIDYSKLIGSKAEQTIVGKNSEIIVKKGQYITTDIISQARRHNVLAKLG